LEKNCNHGRRTKIRFLRTIRERGMTDDVSLMRCGSCGEEFEEALTRTHTLFDLWLLNQSLKTGDYIEVFKNCLGLPHPAEEKPISALECSKYWKSRLEPCDHIGRALVVTSAYDVPKRLVINGVYTLDDSGLSENLIGIIRAEQKGGKH
jgi:hypothetical protein